MWRDLENEPLKREEDAMRIYTSTDLNEILELLKKYNVKYIYVGRLERNKPEYKDVPNQNFDKFANSWM